MKLRSYVFSIGYAALTLIISVLVMTLFWLLPARKRFYFYGLWCRLIVLWARVSCGIRFEIIGSENIPDRPCVIVSNHQSTWETIFLYQLFEHVVPILKKELLNIPFWGWAMRLQKPIAIDRSKPREAGRSMMAQGRERIGNGLSVLVFPEGTRSPAGTVGRLSRSGAQLAVSAGAPLLPVLHNAGDCWPRGTTIKKPGVIQVVVGEAIETEGRSAREVAQLYEDWVSDTMPRLGLRRAA